MPNDTPPPVERLVVLLAEDEPTIAITLRDDLEEHGFEVVHEADGDDAYDHLHKRPFDAVITDLRLPRRGGLELLRLARSRLMDAPLMLITAYASAECEHAARSARATVLHKPFANAAVIAWLRAAFG